MQVNVTFRHVDSSDSLREYAVDRLNRVNKYIDSACEANVVLTVEKFRHIAEVTILFDGYKINGQEETGDLYSAIDMVIDKIERQIKKYRGKIRRRKPNHRITSLGYTMNVLSADDDAEEEGVRVIETQNEYAKPMDVDEAVMQLDLAGQDFLVFTNSQSQQINVIYKRNDGHYGLIQPEKV